MKRRHFYIIFIACFLITCTTTDNRGEKSVFISTGITGITGDIIQAYRQKDYRKVMELANRVVQEDRDDTIPLYYAALACFAEGHEERGMMWFFLAMDNAFRVLEKKKFSNSLLVIPAYKELMPGNSPGVATALWFLYKAFCDNREAKKLFPETELSLVDQVMVIRGCKITNLLYKYVILFCAAHKDHERVHQFVDMLVGFKTNTRTFKVLKQLRDRSSIQALDHGKYISEILDNKEEKTKKKKIIFRVVTGKIELDKVQQQEIMSHLNKWELGYIYYSQAYTFQSKDNNSKAETLYLQALELFKTLPPFGKHPDYGAALYRLALVYVSMGNYSKAEPLYLQALEIRKELPPEGRHSKYVTSLNHLAGLYMSMGNYSKAEPLYLQALEIRKELPPEGRHSKYATSLNDIAGLYMSMGNYSKAELLYLQAMEIYKTLPPEGRHSYYATSMNNLAGLYKVIGDYGKAETFYYQTLEIRKTLPPEDKHRDYAASLNSLAALYHILGDYSKAEAFCLQALEIRKTLPPEGKHRDYAASLDSLAALYHAMGDYSKAEALCLQALEIRKTLPPEGKHRDYADSLESMVALYHAMSDYSKAEALCLQALEIRKTLPPEGKHRDYAASLDSLAALYHAMGDYSKAESLSLQALEIYKMRPQKGNPSYYASALRNLGDLYSTMGNYSKAEPLYLQALEILKIIPPESKDLGYSRILNSLAVLYYEMDNYKRAESLYLQALEIDKALPPKGKHPDYASTLLCLAELYRIIGNYGIAESLCLQALKILRVLPPEGENPAYAATIHNLAVLYNSMGNNSKAETLLLQALEIYKKLPPEGKHRYYASSLNSLANLYSSMGNYSKSESLHLQALEIRKKISPEGRHPHVATTLIKLSVLYMSMGNYTKAEPLLIQSLSISREFLQSNFVTLSEKEKEKFIEPVLNRFQYFYSFLEKRLPSNPILAGTATDFRLFQKAIIFRSVKKIRKRILQSDDGELIGEFNNWLTLLNQINRAYELTGEQRKNQSISLEAWEEEANRLEKRLSSLSEDFRLGSEQKEYTWQDIRAALKPGEVAVELIRYRVFEKKWTDTIHYAVIIIKFDSVQPEIIFLENGNILEEEIIHLYRNFMNETANNPLVRQDDVTYNILYTLLWQPIASRLEGVKRIYFSPDGIYHFINPCTLRDKTGGWLGDRWKFVRITAMQDILDKEQSGNVIGNPPVLAGCPAFDIVADTQRLLVKKQIHGNAPQDYKPVTYRQVSALQPLPGTREEVEAIARLYRRKGETPEVFMGGTALEECIKRVDNPTVLHLATHAFFQEDSAMQEESGLKGVDTGHMADDPLLRSGLLFTGSARILNGKEPLAGLENGILTAREALDLNLDNTELVVLSACDTGLGELKNGEGVYGLQRAFLVAGADAVLMSLWKVDDNVTRDFMIAFYSHWLSGVSKLKAYEEAVVEMRNKYPAPFYWGAFVLVGE